MVRVLVSGTLTSACLGLAGAGFSASLLGTGALPFLICSCAGFIFGAIGFYRSTMAHSLAMLERYPRLIQLHLDANFPSRGFMRWRREDLRPEMFRGSWRMQSLLMTALLTAQPAIDVSAIVPRVDVSQSFRANGLIANLRRTGIGAGGGSPS